MNNKTAIQMDDKFFQIDEREKEEKSY